MLPSFQLVGGAAIAGLVLGAGPTWLLTSTYKDAVWKSSVMVQQMEAMKMLQEATEKARHVERANVIISQKLEAEHHENIQKRAALQRSNRQLAAELGGLRDPGHRESRDHPMSEASHSPSITPSPSSAGTLSAAAQEFLFVLTADADASDDYAHVCYGYAQSVMAMSGEQK